MSPRTVAALLLAAALAPPARAADLNVITSVDVKDEGATVVLSIRGSKKPSFTTFSMAEPPRFVIDFSESKFDGVPETVQIGDGTINVVKNLSYGSDATSIARVMIAFAADVAPPDVADVGATLVVRIAKPDGAAVARTAAPADDGKAAAAAAAAAEEKARADREAQAQAQAQADADARAKAAADEKARAEADARAAKGEADRVAKAAAAAAAAAEAAELRAKDDRARAEQEAQARAEAQRRADEAAAERAEAERQAQAREAERQKAEAVAAAKVAAEPVEAAEPEVAAPAPERRSESSRLEAGAPEAKLREVGFKQLAGTSRVFVRTSVTPKFTIQELGDGTIRLELENTRVERRNDLRFMDTSFFPSAVAMVSPGKHGTSYVLDIKLRQRVPYQQRIEGDVLAIDFERPAQSGAGPQAAAPTGDEPLPAAEEAPEAGATP